MRLMFHVESQAASLECVVLQRDCRMPQRVALSLKLKAPLTMALRAI
jgi:hypothetical protein